MYVILISGKRFVGKDTVKVILQTGLGQCASISLANECKRMYAEKEKLNTHLLINDRAYKEKHRDGLTRYYWVV